MISTSKRVLVVDAVNSWFIIIIVVLGEVGRIKKCNIT